MVEQPTATLVLEPLPPSVEPVVAAPTIPAESIPAPEKSGAEVLASVSPPADMWSTKGIFPKRDKVDFEKRYLDHIKKISEKKAKEQQELEQERKHAEESRERLKRVVLARAEKLRQVREASSALPKPGVEDPTSKAPEGDDKRKLLEKAKLRKFFRSRYVSLLNSLKENAKSKKSEEEEKRRKQEETHKKIKERLGVANVPGKAMRLAKPSLSTKDANMSELPPVACEPRKSLPPAEDRHPPPKGGVSEKIRLRQQQYLQQLAEKKAAEKRRASEERERKDRVTRKLVSEARVQIEKAASGCEKSSKPAAGESKDEPVAKSKPPLSAATQQQAYEDFVARNMVQKKVDVRGVTDLQTWKRKLKLEESARVFIIMGGYPDIRRALKRRGWVENKQKHSVCFDLKWTLKAKDIDYSGLQDFQIVNHYDKNILLTTKAGLCHNLRNLIWFSNVDIDTFYPRSFDLADEAEIEDFKEEFKTEKAECVLKEYLLSGGNVDSVGEEKLCVALNICEKRLRDIDDILDEPNPDLALVTAEEWEILGTDELTPETLARKKHEAWFKRMMRKFESGGHGKRRFRKKPIGKGEEEEENKKEEAKLEQLLEEEEKKQGGEDVPGEETEAEKEKEKGELKQRAIDTLSKMRKRFPQFDLNGYRDIWIVKPAGMSRGRGIRIFNNLGEIMDYSQCREQQFVVQKYMENPMTILNRKFDIRQWVLVTGWNPLTVWFYGECYIRFGAIEYNIKDINNRYMHLTNNSVTKHCEYVDNEIEGNMWEQSDFASYLKVLPHPLRARIGEIRGRHI